ncbi:MAG: helix-turn-helix transcriptional regulator [Candidatus Gastranaerophilales bacterium]|nr:helix-turn-helix transcriptional regulator [Candidatus Gastranaerophilales bacterium]
MVTKNKDKNISKQIKSSTKLAQFLEKNALHKKDFAQMVGVTLSYVYNLIDDTIPFSTRSATLERIAVVMDIKPEEFPEYRIPQEPILIDDTVEFLKKKQNDLGFSTVQFLKAFPRKKRIEIVDILRGALPVPTDWNELKLIANVLQIPNKELYPYWEKRMKDVLRTSGVNLRENQELIDKMFACSEKYLMSKND